MTGRIFGGIGMLALALLGAGLGGCNEQKYKDEIARLQGEKEQLTTEKAQLSTQLQTTQNQLAASQTQRQDPGTTMEPGTGGKPPIGRPMPPSSPTRETRIEVAGDHLFASGSVSIMAAGKAELNKVADRIKREFPGASVRVEGYTDSDPPNKIKAKYPTNEALSLARAKEVEKYLASRGIPSSRIEAVGMGAANPKATKAASRRVEIVVLGN